MKISHKFSLLLILLMVTALGWWLFAGGDKAPASAPVGEEIMTGAAEAPLVQAPVLKTGAHNGLDAGVEQSRVLREPVDFEDDEDPSETLARSVEQMNVADVISRLQQLPLADLRGNLGRLLVRRWAELDPASAGKWAMELGDVEARHELSIATALSWSERDMEGALDWAHSVPDDDTRSLALAGLGYEVARERPVEALHLAASLATTAGRDGLVLHSLQQWAATDPDSARAWLLQWPEGGMRQRALSAFAMTCATWDADAAARFAIMHITPGADLDRAVIGIIQRWAQNDYPAAVSWGEQFPQGALRNASSEWLASFAPR